jgi:aspartyl-tRNA(Asn)/glutamyl-tRNA(Gln) amidotransferase subunit C
MPEDLGRADVERVARLARLRLSDDEITRFAGQLARILAYADTVRQVDTTGVPPLSHPLADEEDHARDDRAVPSLPREDALAPAPGADRRAGFFKVPRVLG